MSEEIQVGHYVNLLVAPREDIQYRLVSRTTPKEVVMMKIVDSFYTSILFFKLKAYSLLFKKEK